jgi:hypothetical protein
MTALPFTLGDGGVAHWRDYLDPVAVSMRLAGRHADVLGYFAKSAENKK